MIDIDTTLSSPIIVNCDATKQEMHIHDKGVCAIGLIVQNHNGRVIDRHGKAIGKTYTSTEAEMEAIRVALTMFVGHNGVRHIVVRSDSKWALARSDDIRDEFDDLDDYYDYVSFEWVPRENNWMADTEADRQVSGPYSSVNGSTQEPAYGLTD